MENEQNNNSIKLPRIGNISFIQLIISAVLLSLASFQGCLKNEVEGFKNKVNVNTDVITNLRERILVLEAENKLLKDLDKQTISDLNARLDKNEQKLELLRSTINKIHN